MDKTINPERFYSIKSLIRKLLVITTMFNLMCVPVNLAAGSLSCYGMNYLVVMGGMVVFYFVVLALAVVSILHWKKRDNVFQSVKKELLLSEYFLLSLSLLGVVINYIAHE